MAAFNPPFASVSQCPVCCNEYHPEEHAPRLLRSCGHTFCETCLSGLQKAASNPSVVRCPSCQVETAVEVDKGVAESFPKNYPLLESIENVKTAAVREAAVLTTEKCEICSKRQAQFGCIECETNFCNNCWELSHKAHAHRKHEKMSPGDVFEAKCRDHPLNNADLVCLESSCPAWGSLICLLCEKAAAHKGHFTEPIEQVAADKRKRLHVAISNAQKNVAFALSILANVQEADELLNGVALAGEDKDKGVPSTGVQSNREKALVIIDRMFQQLIIALEQRRAALIEQVESLVKTKSEKLEEQRTELCTFLSCSYTRLHDATQALNRTNDAVFISSFLAHRDLLVETTSTELFPEPVVTPLVDIAFTQDLMPEIPLIGMLHDNPILQYRRSSNAILGTFVHTFGSNEVENGQFDSLCGLAFSPDGLLFVVDQKDRRIRVFRADGTFIHKFGSQGAEDGQFENPYGLAFSPDGYLFVSDWNTHRIQVFRADGTFIRKFGSQGAGDGQFNMPNGLAFSPDGHLFVSDLNNHRIQVFRTDGIFVHKFGSHGAEDGQFQNPCGLAFGPNGHLFVSDSNNSRIQMFRADGTFVHKFGLRGSGDGQFVSPIGLAFSPDGHLFVSDSEIHRIQVFK